MTLLEVAGEDGAAVLRLAYIHILYARTDPFLEDIRHSFSGPLDLNRPGRSREQIGADISAGLADIEALGVMALANPDLVHRLKSDAPLNDVRPALFNVGGGPEGYTDYPAIGAV